MHLFLAFCHFIYLLDFIYDDVPPQFQTASRALQMVGVIAETVNFALMLTLSVSMIKDFKFDSDPELSENIELMKFRRWILIESVMFSVTVLANILVCLTRTFFKDYIQIDMDQIEG